MRGLSVKSSTLFQRKDNLSEGRSITESVLHQLIYAESCGASNHRIIKIRWQVTSISKTLCEIRGGGLYALPFLRK